MRKTFVFLIFAFLLLIYNFAQAVPQKISFQGVLKDSAGNLVTANKDITFRIYDVASSGTSLWGETQTVSVEAGLYTVELGSVTAIPLTLFNGDTRYLGIEVDGAQLSPRIVVLSVPYAYRANYADTAGSAGASSGSVLFCPVTVQTTSSANAIYIQSSAAGSAPSNYVGVISLEASGPYAVSLYITSGGINAIGLASIVKANQSKGIVATVLDGVQGSAVDASAHHAAAYAVRGTNNLGVGLYGEGMTAGYFKADETGGVGVYGKGNTVGGSFEGYGVSSRGVYGNSTAYDGIGGYFKSHEGGGVGVFGTAFAGGSFESIADNGKGIYARASGNTSSAVYGENTNNTGNSGYFTGGKGVQVATGSMEVTAGNLILKNPYKPAVFSSPGEPGSITWGEDGTIYYIYMYVGGRWRRATLEAY